MRIFLCDDSRSFCAAVGFWLEEAEDLQLVGVANDRATALEMLPEARADDVRAAAQGARVVVYSGHAPAAARHFVTGDPDAYLVKGDDPDHLIDALRALD
jgi:DNA-binding NarL/FixJ family response regulator